MEALPHAANSPVRFVSGPFDFDWVEIDCRVAPNGNRVVTVSLSVNSEEYICTSNSVECSLQESTRLVEMIWFLFGKTDLA